MAKNQTADVPGEDSPRADDIRQFREPAFCRRGLEIRAAHDGETEADYRAALRDHVVPKDFIEAYEIRTGKRQDEWGESENDAPIQRMDVRRNTLMGKIKSLHKSLARERFLT